LVGWRKRVGDHDQQTLFTLRDLASTLEAQGKWSEAEAEHREALIGWRKLAGNEDPQTMYTLRSLGLVLETEHKWSEAETNFREALAVSRKKPAANQDPEALVDVERLVRVLLVQNKLGEAEQALGEVLTPSFVRQPSSTNLLIQRINLLGRRGRWQEATTDAALALEYQPSDHYRYHTLAGLLVTTHNRPEYELICRRLLTKFADTSNPYIAERVVDDCLLLPDFGVDLGLVDKLADAAVKGGSGYVDMPYFQACKAMSNYRLRHFPEAIEWAEKVVRNSQAEAPAEARAKAYAVLGMAHWQLGQKDVAREMLAEGDKLTPSILSGHEAVDLGEIWLAWLFARIQLDEATSLIQAGPTNVSDVQILNSTRE
jgi:tetratricopeptide (TPR) repeat protein